jgi:hypothetical protein
VYAVAPRLGVAADALFDLTVEHRPEGQGGITQEVFRNLTVAARPTCATSSRRTRRWSAS